MDEDKHYKNGKVVDLTAARERAKTQKPFRSSQRQGASHGGRPSRSGIVRQKWFIWLQFGLFLLLMSYLVQLCQGR